MQQEILTPKNIANVVKNSKQLENIIMNKKDKQAVIDYLNLRTYLYQLITNTKEYVIKETGVTWNRFANIVYTIYAKNDNPKIIKTCELIGKANTLLDRMDKFIDLLPDNIISLQIIEVDER